MNRMNCSCDVDLAAGCPSQTGRECETLHGVWLEEESEPGLTLNTILRDRRRLQALLDAISREPGARERRYILRRSIASRSPGGVIYKAFAEKRPRTCKAVSAYLQDNGLAHSIRRYQHRGHPAYFAVEGGGAEGWRESIILGPTRIGDLTYSEWLEYVTDHRNQHSE